MANKHYSPPTIFPPCWLNHFWPNGSNRKKTEKPCPRLPHSDLYFSSPLSKQSICSLPSPACSNCCFVDRPSLSLSPSFAEQKLLFSDLGFLSRRRRKQRWSCPRRTSGFSPWTSTSLLHAFIRQLLLFDFLQFLVFFSRNCSCMSWILCFCPCLMCRLRNGPWSWYFLFPTCWKNHFFFLSFGFWFGSGNVGLDVIGMVLRFCFVCLCWFYFCGKWWRAWIIVILLCIVMFGCKIVVVY